jgi:hypothetical protein
MTAKYAKISIMTHNDIINALIMCKNEEFRYEARLFGVGIIETLSGTLFIYSSFYYKFYPSAAACLFLASLLRARASLKLYSSYFPPVDQSQTNQYPFNKDLYDSSF